MCAVSRRRHPNARAHSRCHRRRVISPQGYLHLSAPSIYASVLEALELRRGLSFLNIGSGSGYLSALAAHTSLLGPDAVHHGVELRPSLVSHAAERCIALGLDNIRFTCADCFAIDVGGSMKFDRIYVGAGARSDAKFLFGLLKVGGILVGPFEHGTLGEQHLIQTTRTSERDFEIRRIMSVTFAELIAPPPPSQAHADSYPEAVAGTAVEAAAAAVEVASTSANADGAAAADSADADAAEDSEDSADSDSEDEGYFGRAPVPPPARTATSLVLTGPTWAEHRPCLFSRSYIDVVVLLRLGASRDDSLVGKLPWELWHEHVLPHVPFDAFDD